MLIVPGLPPMQETRHSRELSRRLEEVVRDYQRDHPEMSESEVRAALLRSAPVGSTDVARTKRMVGAMVAAALAAGFVAMAVTGGGRFGPTSVGWGVLGAVAAVGAVAITIIRLVRRD